MTPTELLASFDTFADAPDGTKRLRELVLNLAVRGKLVDQNSSEQGASYLLDAIQKKKAAAIKTGSARNRSRFDKPAVAVSTEGLPAGWAYTTIGEVTEVVRGITFPSSAKNKARADGLVACLRTANIQDSIEWDDLLFVPKEFIKQKDQHLRTNDIVMSMANSRELVGKVALVESLPHPTSFGGFLSVLRPHILEPRFLMLILRSAEVREALIERATQTTNIANISLAKLLPQRIRLAPLEEQGRIVAKVDELMARIDELETFRNARDVTRVALRDSALATLEEAAGGEGFKFAWERVSASFDEYIKGPEDVGSISRAILGLAVRGKLVHQDSSAESASVLIKRVEDTWGKGARPFPGTRDCRAYAGLIDGPNELPRGWTWRRLGFIAHDHGQQVPQTKFTYIDVGSIDNKLGVIATPTLLSAPDAPSRARKLVKRDSVIYSTVRPYLLNIAVVGRDYTPVPIASTAFAVFQTFPFVLPRYLFLYLRSPFFQSYVESKMRGVAYPAINDATLMQAPIALPPLAEQQRIVAKVDELMAACDQLGADLTAETSSHQSFAAAAVHHLSF